MGFIFMAVDELEIAPILRLYYTCIGITDRHIILSSDSGRLTFADKWNFHAEYFAGKRGAK